MLIPEKSKLRIGLLVAGNFPEPSLATVSKLSRRTISELAVLQHQELAFARLSTQIVWKDLSHISTNPKNLSIGALSLHVDDLMVGANVFEKKSWADSTSKLIQNIRR